MLKRFPFLFGKDLKNDNESSKKKKQNTARRSCSKWGMQDVFLYTQKPFHLVWQEPTHIHQLKNDSPL
jgi:hypothetical protein